MTLYTLSDVQNAIPAAYFARGLDYLERGRVKTLTQLRGGHLISAQVRGSSPFPYKVVLHVTTAARGTQLNGDCTCPVGHNCKHVAAVALAALSTGAKKRPVATARATANPRLIRWLERLDAATHTAAADEAADVPDYVIYLLSLRGQDMGQPALDVRTVVARRLKTGGWGQPRSGQVKAHSSARYIRAVDQRLLRWIGLCSEHGWLRPQGQEGPSLLSELIATGRCHWRTIKSPPLMLGEPRTVQLEWVATRDGLQRLRCLGDEDVDEVLPLSPPWYVDLSRNQCGPLNTGLPDSVAQALLESPSLHPDDVPRVQQALDKLGAAIPQPRRFQSAVEKRVKPVPCLRLFQAEVPNRHSPHAWKAASKPVQFPLARLDFDYDGIRVVPGITSEPDLTRLEGERLVQIRRDAKAEQAAMEALEALEFMPLSNFRDFAPTPEQVYDRTLMPMQADPHDAHLNFSLHGVPELRRQGWRVEIADDWPYRLVEETGDWYAELEESGNDWFSLELGVTVDGERLNLLPILVDILAQNPELAEFLRLPAEQAPENMFVRLPNERLLPIPFERVRNFLGTLVELYDTQLDHGRLRLPTLQVAQIQDLRDVAWEGSTRLRELARKLEDFQGIQKVSPPTGLRTALRAYQRQGLDWLQFLREYALAGILADDMGLGKTVQTLAHLLLEKESGRMDRPSLVIAPTSLMTNWCTEAERFAPDLSVLVLHGAERKQNYARLKDADLVLTTYPLLSRDQNVLSDQDYHLLILDEAQVVKNSKAKAAQVVRQLNAKHRLCLTGTPMENHLGEMWALFDFLLPGLLGDERRFRKLFRTPIEKHGDSMRQVNLRRRVAPFMLRRTKQEVVKELPPKTEMVHAVELSGAQRDLYESIRLAMHKKVRNEIEKKGMARSHIVILEALLKLRQVCCDPRLLKLASARKAQYSAKLGLLMDMLPELVEEGRRILLFSQFTSMLALIEPELDRVGIDYVRLTGNTRNRAKPIEQFQEGEVPVFLISLKAGGTGLNLTAADTVIHYDPWWNPAVETQATDRAHRIGQDKAVFVYKLITQGTVEEKILAMQARKKELADRLFDEAGNSASKLVLDDLEGLFEPLG